MPGKLPDDGDMLSIAVMEGSVCGAPRVFKNLGQKNEVYIRAVTSTAMVTIQYL